MVTKDEQRVIEIARLRAALAEAQAEIERLKNPWLPIELAPRDKAGILTYGTHDHSGLSSTTEISFWDGKGWQIAWAQDYGLYHQPTHYAPIPAPPGNGL